MPQDLAALLVDEGAVSKADVDRALARQAQEGGALDTALLELGLIGEGHLLSFLSHASGLPPAPEEAFREVDARARRVFPARVAERHRLAPFALDGRELSVVASHPLDAAAIDEIGFMLSLTLVPHIGVEWRVRDLIQRLYGGQLPARFAKLMEASPPKPAARSIEDAFFAAGEDGTFSPAPAPGAEPPPERGTAAAELEEPSFAGIEPERLKPTGFGGDGSEPAEPLLAALEQAVDAYDVLWADEAPPAEPVGGAAPPALEPEPEPAARAQGAEDAAPAEVAPEPQEAGEPEEPPPELDRSAPPRWSIDDARTALAAARHRDEVVLTALRFARDFFEFSALLAVTRDAVVGHDALGLQEDARLHARATAIYATDAGIVKTVLETKAPYLGAVVRDAPGTGNVLDGLWRGTPRTVLLYPILVGDRPVAVLYADNGEAPVSVRRLGDLLLFLSTLGAVFERIIRSRKKRPRRASQTPKPGPPRLAAEPPVPDPAPAWMAPPPSGAEPEPDAFDAGAGPTPTPQPPAPMAVESPAPRVRAAEAVVTLVAPGPDVADAVAPIVDLLLEADPEVAAAAREALAGHRGKPVVRPVAERLRRALLSGVGERPVLAASALAALRDVDSIPILIQALEGGAPAAAAHALTEITLQDFGASARKWLKWWKENRGRTRAEWLFAALTSPEIESRIAAAQELRAAGEPPVAYAHDLPSADLEAAARAWRIWWSRQGLSL